MFGHGARPRPGVWMSPSRRDGATVAESRISPSRRDRTTLNLLEQFQQGLTNQFGVRIGILLLGLADQRSDRLFLAVTVIVDDVGVGFQQFLAERIDFIAINRFDP